MPNKTHDLPFCSGFYMFSGCIWGTVSGLAVSRISVQQGIGEVTDRSEMTSDRSFGAGVGVSSVTEEPRRLRTGCLHSFPLSVRQSRHQIWITFDVSNTAKRQKALFFCPDCTAETNTRLEKSPDLSNSCAFDA